MFADYQSLVVLDYQKKREANVLPLSLSRPSPAQVKSECLRVCTKRFDRKDERALTMFFGEISDKMACLQAIKRCGIDKFRPLVNFLKESTESPGEKNIELLAWLIDFEPRPWEFGKEYATLTSTAGEATLRQAFEKPVGRRKSRKWMAWLLLFALVGFGIYWLAIHRSTRGPEFCMVWVGDRYQQVPCGQRHGDTPVVPLDAGKLEKFKRITRPDTITQDALGSVWYSVRQGVYECYTSPGHHPVDTSLSLQRLTDFVLRRHIRPGWDPDQTK